MENVRKVTTDEVSALDSLTREIKLLLSEVREETKWLSKLAEQHSEFMNTRWIALRTSKTQSDHPCAQVLERANTLADREGSFADFVKTRCELVADGADVAIRQIDEKMAKVSSQGYSQGDLPKWLKCGAYGAVMGGGTATGNVWAVAMAGLAAADLTCFEWE